MSFQAMSWATKLKVGNATGKAILLVLANYADENGACYPSQKRLSDECECSIATVARWLKNFEEKEVLSRKKQYGDGGYRRSDRLFLNLQLTELPITELPITELPNSDAVLTTHSDGAEPVREPLENNTVNSIPKKPDFETEFETIFWPQYPRKRSIDAARKAFKAARKKFKLPDIMAGVHRYAAERDGQDDRFTKHASSWLNQQCWLDEPDPPPKHQNQAKEDNFGNTVSELNRRLNGHEPSDFDRCEAQASQGMADEFNPPTIEGTSNRVFG